MRETTTTTDLFFSAFIDDLCAFAVRERQVPVPIARTAAEATLRALGGESDSASLRNRARAYYWKVVRRCCYRDPDAAAARAHFLLAAVVADLEEVGWERGKVWEEIERGWADRVPEVVLDEYRQRFCA